MSTAPLDLGIAALRAAYRAGRLTPRAVLAAIHADIAATRRHHIWLDVLDQDALAPLFERLDALPPAALPLWGIPFAIKDNIDLAGRPTTAACPAFAYTPARSAFVVEQLLAAGAVPVGKTNLDQFATGLVGTRSPYGATANAFDAHYISGGSSSGSAVAVALGQASFALGTDTAGSGRIPAAFNNLVGIKPTRGAISTRGVVPACRSLDCVSVFALDFADAAAVMRVAARFDADDPWARSGAGAAPATAPDRALTAFDFAVPAALEFHDDEDHALFTTSVRHLERLGGRARTIDYAPFAAVARLLYEGPWVAERYAGIDAFLATHADTLHPVTRAIIEPACKRTAVEYFQASARLAELRQVCMAALAGCACLLVPAAPLHPTQAAVAADPIGQNSLLGAYTNFMNLLDLAGVAVPVALRADGRPFGVTLCAPAWHDDTLARLGARLHAACALPRGARGLAPRSAGDSDVQWLAPAAHIDLCVCGAHMHGLPLNHQLLERGARLLERTHTAPCYRLYALPGGPPARPGLVRQPAGGAAIEVEVWRLPQAELGGFVAGVPAPLAIGSIELADHRQVHGFLCEAHAAVGAQDITRHGGWRAWLAEAAALG